MRRSGRKAEARVIRLIQDNRQSWVRGVRYATAVEDHEGIDIVVSTDRGRLLLQVKAGRGNQKRNATWYADHGIGVVRVVPGWKDGAVLNRIRHVMLELYEAAPVIEACHAG